MRKARYVIVAIALVLVAGVLITALRRSGSAATIVGVVRATEVRVEPEVNGQLMSIAVEKGAQVRSGDVLARLSALALTTCRPNSQEPARWHARALSPNNRLTRPRTMLPARVPTSRKPRRITM